MEIYKCKKYDDPKAITAVGQRIFFGDLPATCQRDIAARLGDFVFEVDRAGWSILGRGTALFVETTIDLDTGIIGPMISLYGWHFFKSDI